MILFIEDIRDFSKRIVFELNMWAVKKFPRGKYKAKGVFLISDPDKQRLINVFVNGESASSNEIQKAFRFAQSLRERDFWIECDCVHGKEKPYLSVGQKNGRIYLIHMNGRGLHKKTCPFFSLPVPTFNCISRPKRWSEGSILHLHQSISQIDFISNNNDRRHKVDAVQRNFPKLGKLLLSLLHNSGLNQLANHKLNINDQFFKLHDSIKSYFLEPGIPASDYFFTFPEYLDSAKHLLKKKNLQWPKNSRPHFLFALLIDSIDDSIAICRRKFKPFPIKFYGSVKFLSERVASSGPFIFLFSYTDSPNFPGRYVPYNAFGIPVLCRYLLIPVESNYERKVLEKLNESLSTWEDEGVKVTIEKPLFDVKVGDTSVRPDFILSSKSKRVILEVQGSDNPEYLERKHRTHNAMRNLGELVSFDAYQAKKRNQWNSDISKMVKEISKILLSKGS